VYVIQSQEIKHLCMIGMVIGIGLIGLLPVLHDLSLFGYSQF
jgi:hypothetical protein